MEMSVSRSRPVIALPNAKPVVYEYVTVGDPLQNGTILDRCLLYHLSESKRCHQSMQWNNATITASPTAVFNPEPTLRLAQPSFEVIDAGSVHRPTEFASETQLIQFPIELLSTWHQSAFKSVILSTPVEPGPALEWYGQTWESPQHWAMTAVVLAHMGRAQ
jgi:hypothetical protein